MSEADPQGVVLGKWIDKPSPFLVLAAWFKPAAWENCSVGGKVTDVFGYVDESAQTICCEMGGAFLLVSDWQGVLADV